MFHRRMHGIDSKLLRCVVLWFKLWCLFVGGDIIDFQSTRRQSRGFHFRQHATQRCTIHANGHCHVISVVCFICRKHRPQFEIVHEITVISILRQIDQQHNYISKRECMYECMSCTCEASCVCTVTVLHVVVQVQVRTCKYV